MGKKMKYLVILSIIQHHAWSLNAQEEETLVGNGSSDVCHLNMEFVKGQLTNSDDKIEKSLDEQTAEILEQIKKIDVKTNLGVYETFIENTIVKKLLNLQAKTSSGTIEAVHLISMIINERFGKIEKTVENMNDQLQELNKKVDNFEQKLNSHEAPCTNTPAKGPQRIGKIYDCALAKHLELTSLSTGKYHFNSNNMSWYDAKKFCEKYDMQLVTINSDAEARAIVRSREDFYGYWTSASDIGRTPGLFYWADGQPTEKWIWSAGEPNHHGAGKEACGLLVKNYQIGDLPCSWKFPFICEQQPYCKNK